MGNICGARISDSGQAPLLPIKPHYRKAFARSSTDDRTEDINRTADQTHHPVADTSGKDLILCNAPSGELDDHLHVRIPVLVACNSQAWGGDTEQMNTLLDCKTVTE